MPTGAPGQRKGGERECKVCAHPGLKEIEAMLLNGALYTAIIATMQRNYPQAPRLTKPNLTNHKQNHLLNQAITRTVTNEDGTKEVQTYLTGHYEATSLVIPQESVPQIPALPDALKIIIAAALHNALNNPALVSVKDGLEAMKLLRQVGGGQDGIDQLLGAWQEVEGRKQTITKRAKATRTRTVTVEEQVEVPAETVTIDGDWSAEHLDALALPEAADGE